jgi:hypothetical protein
MHGMREGFDQFRRGGAPIPRREGLPGVLPLCMDLFQRAPKRFASGERPKTIVEELFAEIQWKDKGQ